jgi:hypothetical protein
MDAQIQEEKIHELSFLMYSLKDIGFEHTRKHLDLLQEIKKNKVNVDDKYQTIYFTFLKPERKKRIFEFIEKEALEEINEIREDIPKRIAELKKELGL